MAAGDPAEIDAVALPDPKALRQAIVGECRPVILRGLVAGWPAVAAGACSPAAFRDYLRRFVADTQIEAFFGARAIGGRYYYNDDLSGFNFERRRMSVAGALDAILAGLDDPDGATVYMGSAPVADHLPGFSADNPMPLLPASVGGRIWLGHASNVSCHYDTLDNIACVIAGRRRFTLYPPDAIGDLYVGPIDNTMAGQPVSLAASTPADPDRFPRFAAAADRALEVELEPGDALYIPKLWWHQVRALAPFNGLLNYWWDATGSGPDAPYTTLLLAMIAIAERPPVERAAWKAFFDHYVFRTNGHPLAHLPDEHHGLLGPLRPHNYGRIRAYVMQMLRGGR